MLQSQLFSKAIKEEPSDEESVNARLLTRAGFIRKLTAGVYNFLPLGARTLKKIEDVIRQEMNAISGQEVILAGLTPKKNWQITGRWDAFDALFRLKDIGDKEYALAATLEEVIVPLVQEFVFSYKDLPCYVYQIQNKFRNELRAKSGLFRTREFLMKDLYSFHADEKDRETYYETVKKAYFTVFERMELSDKTYLTLASGGTFSEFSHEFQIVTPAGEDVVYICPKCRLGINKELLISNGPKFQPKCPQCGSKELTEEKTIEAANIFDLKTKYTEAFNFEFIDRNGEKKPVIMGCYGIGLSRLMGAVAEVHHDARGIIWPKEIAPFQAHLICLESASETKKVSEQLYQDLQKTGIEVLYDDREEKSAGEKFSEADLIGIPFRIVVSKRTLKKESAEVKERKGEKTMLVETERLPEFLKSLI